MIGADAAVALFPKLPFAARWSSLAQAVRCPPVALASRFGTREFWEDQYNGSTTCEFIPADKFSWYASWEDIAPFFAELVPDRTAEVLVPGVGNDQAMVDLYDAGWEHLHAFDFSSASIERTRTLFGDRRLVDLRCADARQLPYADSVFDAALDKGTLDSVLQAGESAAERRDNLQAASDELARVVRPGGTVVSLTGFPDKVGAAFADARMWRCLRDGGVHITEDGFASNQIDAHLMAWARLRGGATSTMSRRGQRLAMKLSDATTTARRWRSRLRARAAPPWCFYIRLLLFSWAARAPTPAHPNSTQ